MPIAPALTEEQMANISTATYTGGSDSSVGFAVPPDAGEDENIKALRSMYEALDTSDPIRIRAEAFVKQYQDVHKTAADIQTVVDAQKQTASLIIPIAKSISDATQSADVKSSDFTGRIANWQVDAVAALQTFKSHNFHLKDICPVLIDCFKVFDSVVKGDLSLEDALPTIQDSANKAVENLYNVQQSGYGIPLQNSAIGQDNIGAVQKNYEYMVGDVKASLLRKELQSSVTQKLIGESGGDNITTLVEVTSEPEGETVKTALRLLEETDQQATPPDRIPNYHLALESSPRVCGNCRFFKGEPGVKGRCRAFDSEVSANYVCDAWQALSLTEVHTVMRNDTSDNKHLPESYRSAPVQDLAEATPAPVDNIAELDIEPNDTMRAVQGQYAPGDQVYSKALRSYGIIQSCQAVDGIEYYSLKLINMNGVASGSAYTAAPDLQRKSNKATKNGEVVYDAGKLEDDLNQITQATRQVYKTLKGISDEHRALGNIDLGAIRSGLKVDVIKPILTNTEVVVPLLNGIKEVLVSDIFQNVTTGPKRKYFRAVQNAMVSVGAARQVLFEAAKTINYLKNRPQDSQVKTQMYASAVTAQKQAYDRIQDALKMVQDSLVMPSATHGYEAPGID